MSKPWTERELDKRFDELKAEIAVLRAEKEAREVELRMLRASNTALNERLEAAEYDCDIALADRDTTIARAVAAEQERDDALDRLVDRTADWNLTLARAEEAEAALEAERKSHVHARYGGDAALRTLEGREEKP